MTPQPLSHPVRSIDISFYSDGLIIISSRVAQILSLRAGDVINVMRDANEYMLVAIHVARDSNDRPIGRYRHAVNFVKGKKGQMRCFNKRLCTGINFVTGALESHLFCGAQLDGYSTYGTALPLIVSNNQLRIAKAE